MAQLIGKYVLLTGGSRGIGPIIADALAKRGAHIALTARDEDGLRAVEDSLGAYDIQTMILPVDLLQPTQRFELVSRVMDRFGAIDILINNAGVETEGAFTDLTLEAIQKTVEVNLVAPMALTHLVLPHMLSRKDGHIVNIASIGAKSGAPYAATYCGTKAGMAEWARALRLELEGTGVHFSTIFPGYVTGIGMFARYGIAPPSLIGSCTPEEVARAVIEAIEEERIETIVNSRPVRMVFALNELSPPLGDRIMHQLGIVDFQRRKVDRLKRPE